MEKSPRTTAAEIIYKILNNNAFSNIEISNSLNESGLSDKDKALCHAIAMTALEKKLTIEYIIKLYVKKEPDLKAMCVLFVGAVQILFMDKIPDMAACNETVKTASEILEKKQTGFINGVLRNICRQKEDIISKINKTPPDIKYSLDKSIVDLLKSQYENTYTEIFDGFSVKARTCLKINTLKTTHDSVLKQLETTGMPTLIEEGYLFINSGLQDVLHMIEDGSFYIQGASSQEAVKMLDCLPGMLVVDACACPGGKSIGAAIAMKNKGEIISLDIHENKLPLIEKSAKKLGIDIIKTLKHDSKNPIAQYTGKVNRVICDVPCSALGTIPSRPEIRYKNMNNIEKLKKLQREILSASSLYLEKEGIMVYSTCTLNKEENEGIVKPFIEKNNNFELLQERYIMPKNGFYDGFYAAKIKRIK